MILTNIESVPGYKIVALCGVVSGSTVRCKHAGKDILAGLKNIFGGEIKGYTELLEDSRKEALQRMMSQARSINADGIINIRFSTSAITVGAAEVFAYGTAVKLAKA